MTPAEIAVDTRPVSLPISVWTHPAGANTPIGDCRSAGSSYMNRVELQNGCLALAIQTCSIHLHWLRVAWMLQAVEE